MTKSPAQRKDLHRRFTKAGIVHVSGKIKAADLLAFNDLVAKSADQVAAVYAEFDRKGGGK